MGPSRWLWSLEIHFSDFELFWSNRKLIKPLLVHMQFNSIFWVLPKPMQKSCCRSSLWRHAERGNIFLYVGDIAAGAADGLFVLCQRHSERPGWGGEGVSPIAQMVSLQRGGLWGACLSPGGLSQHLRWPSLVLEDEPQVQMEHPGVSTHLAEPQGISPILLVVKKNGCSYPWM